MKPPFIPDFEPPYSKDKDGYHVVYGSCSKPNPKGERKGENVFFNAKLYAERGLISQSKAVIAALKEKALRKLVELGYRPDPEKDVDYVGFLTTAQMYRVNHLMGIVTRRQKLYLTPAEFKETFFGDIPM